LEPDRVNIFRLKRPYILTAFYLFFTIIIGMFASFLPLNGIECNIAFNLHNFAQKMIGIQVFKS
jgi:hypothetical protein